MTLVLLIGPDIDTQIDRQKQTETNTAQGTRLNLIEELPILRVHVFHNSHFLHVKTTWIRFASVNFKPFKNKNFLGCRHSGAAGPTTCRASSNLCCSTSNPAYY